MKDGGEEYKGFELGYNFRSKRGRIDVGDTEMDGGFYHGEEIKKVDKDVLFVADGWYTTCDAKEPHYSFFSPKMRVKTQSNIVAEPIYLYVANVPVFALPFAVFPNKGGRRSGIIAPAYGDDASRGKFLSHLGYYWAISDYIDANLRSDLYTKGGWALYSDVRYSLRYYFNGSLSGEYRRLHMGEPSDPRRSEEESYRLNIFHNQEINPTTRLNVNFTFASNNSYLNTINLRQALDQSLVSNATISKSWEGTPNSISLNVSRRQNLVNSSVDEVLPSVSFNHSQSFPFRKSKSKAGTSVLEWYEQIGMSYGAQATSTQAKINRTVGGILVNQNGRDTLISVNDFERNRRQSLSQNIGMSISPKLGYITISPSMSYRDERSFTNNDVPTSDTASKSLKIVKKKESSRAGYFSTGISAGTKFYGMVQPGIFGVEAIRHTVTPSLSFSYQKQIVGQDHVGKQMFMSLSVDNVFEMKTTPSEANKEPEKIQLLNLGTGISYNFSADSLNFSTIGVSYRTGIGNSLNISGSADFDLYKLEQTSPGNYVRVNKFLIKEEGRLARMTNFSISMSTSLSGEAKKSSDKNSSDTLVQKQPVGGYYGLYQEEEPDFSIPWRLSLSWDFSENKVPPYRFRSSNVRGSLEFNLTEKWKFSVGGGYDIMNREVVVPDVHISRDLHCWTMDFTWVPFGNWRHYQLEIRVKASQLRDLKVTKQGSDRGIY
jgi:lipopolysaccharide assembly outer membrane protein LptD (OstA)